MFEPMTILDQLLVANRKQRASQRGKHRQFIVGPFDRGERGAQGFDLGSVVERTSSHEQVRNLSGLERFDVQPRHVLVVTDEATKQQTHVARLDRDELFLFARLEAERHARHPHV